MKKVQIGYFPPPFGGISVYFYRLSKTEKDTDFIDQKILIGNKKLRFWLIKQIFNFKKKNFIIHTMLLREQIIFYLLSRLSIHKFSLVIHGKQLLDQYYKSKNLKRYLVKNMLNKAFFIQVVNPDYKFLLDKFGVKNKRIIIKSAYLPPPLEDEEKICESYDINLNEFIKNHKPILIANAAALFFYKDIDLYGLDVCIELTILLKETFPDIGFLFALADKNINLEYQEKMKKRISELKIDSNFYFITGQKEIWPLFKKVDLMIRPTIIDGFSVSIAESLYFNCPTIASDVVKRPKNTVLFKNRDIKDLYEKCLLVLKK